VRSRPGSRVIGRLDDRTEFGSRQVLSAVTTRGPWLGVASSARTDGRLGWVDGRSSALRLTAAEVSIQADLSRRRVELRSGNRLLARARVTVGRPGSSTPTGRFAVTDKLNGRDMSPYYGCCILALSGTQPNLPAGWSGGDRLAIHGTDDPGSIGTASSAGCLRARESDIKRLMRRVPHGTPVEIRR
jgi:lipoprotein-anchoring transpeptidase ErfK/SrfK